MTAPLPSPGLWIIQRPKIVAYLLNLSHRKGGPKARLLMQFGFDPADPHALAEAIWRHAIDNGPGSLMQPSVGPPRSVIEGPMNCPDGRPLNVRTIWERATAAEARFITLVPLPA